MFSLQILKKRFRYYFDYVTDYADVILSCITCFFSLCLLCQIIYVATRVKVDFVFCALIFVLSLLTGIG
jgi:hypothetical protein